MIRLVAPIMESVQNPATNEFGRRTEEVKGSDIQMSLRILPKFCSLALLASLVLVACDEREYGKQAPLITIEEYQFPSTYQPKAASAVLIKNATILDGAGRQLERTDLRLAGGKIVEVGAGLLPAQDETVIDGAGKWVTPGIIDIHSHLGAYPSPSVPSNSNGNEATQPVTAEVWVEHSVSPKDAGFDRARAGGVTAMQILPGSANLFGGRSVTLKNVSARTVQAMRFPGAPYGLKLACGENPKRVYGDTSSGPQTRMGNVAGYRQAWVKAQEYKLAWEKYERDHWKGKDPTPPKRDLELDTLRGVLEGKINVHMHCYTGAEMAIMIDVMKEFGYQIATFEHAVEAYKVRDLLAENNICASMWADWWGFKMEAYDGIPENVPFVHEAGACAIVHSDSELGIQRLNQEAAKALADGQAVGAKISKAEAWAWLSSNPAKALGIFEQTGSIEPGKAADVVLWNGDPFSTYTKAELVFIDGATHYDLNDPNGLRVSDFELGQSREGVVR
jgi:imidazolonepropionase-like amidohydrolase